MTSRSRLTAVSIWAIVSAAVLLVATESLTRVALRLAYGAWPQAAAVLEYRRAQDALELYRRHPYLNTAPREGVEVTRQGRSASLNSTGYRSPERPRDAPPGTMRLVCSGGSTTFDLTAESNDQSWPWMLETRLRASGREIEVWNAGFPGWTSLENTISLLIRDQDLRPDVVIFFQGINDLQPAAHRPFDRQYEAGHADRQLQALGFTVGPPAIWDRSVLLERLHQLLLPRSLDSDVATELDPEARDVFQRNVSSFVSIARSAGADVILATQPIRVRADQREDDLVYLESWLGIGGESVPAQLEVLNEVLRKVAESEGVILADLAVELEFDDKDFADPMHYTRSGSRKIADFFSAAAIGALDSRARGGRVENSEL